MYSLAGLTNYRAHHHQLSVKSAYLSRLLFANERSVLILRVNVSPTFPEALHVSIGQTQFFLSMLLEICLVCFILVPN